jgi:hypothetical protein
LLLTAVVFVENLKRHRTIGAGRPVGPVHGGVPAPAERCVDDITREVTADHKHDSSVGRVSGGLFWPHDYLFAVPRR